MEVGVRNDTWPGILSFIIRRYNPLYLLLGERDEKY